MTQQTERPGFSFCAGPDIMLLKKRAQALLSSFPPPAPSGGGGLLGAMPGPAKKEWENLVFWADEGLNDKFWEYLTLQGLFAGPKALWVRNAEKLPAEIWKKLSLALGRPNELAWPIFCLEVDFEKGKPKIPAHIQKLQAWNFAEQKGWVTLVPPLDPRGIANFARAEAQELGISFAPGGLEAICAALPPDGAAIHLEMEKIALALKPGEKAAPAHASLITHQKNIDIFALLRVLQSGQNASAAWAKVMRDAEEGEEGIFAFLAMLLREARQLWQLLAGEQVFMPPQAVGAKTALAKTLGFSGLGKIWELALAAEKGIKSGERSPEQTQEKLLAELFILFKTR